MKNFNPELYKSHLAYARTLIREAGYPGVNHEDIVHETYLAHSNDLGDDKKIITGIWKTFYSYRDQQRRLLDLSKIGKKTRENIVTERFCKHCLTTHSVSEFYSVFDKDANCYIYRNVCKKILRQQAREYASIRNNSPARKKYMKKYYKKNKKALKKYKAQYYLDNKRKIKERIKTNYAKNPGKLSGTALSHYHENKKIVKVKRKAYRKKNRSKINAQKQRWRQRQRVQGKKVT
ncbi:MAG TPA: hypothetical protein VFV08_07675 [Puia sp.]|nr:hypothetical protein [Puia sp.]